MNAGLVKPWEFDGGEVEWVSLVGIDASISISIVTHHETMKVTACSDLGYTGEKVSCKDLVK